MFYRISSKSLILILSICLPIFHLIQYVQYIANNFIKFKICWLQFFGYSLILNAVNNTRYMVSCDACMLCTHDIISHCLLTMHKTFQWCKIVPSHTSVIYTVWTAHTHTSWPILIWDSPYRYHRNLALPMCIILACPTIHNCHSYEQVRSLNEWDIQW